MTAFISGILFLVLLMGMLLFGASPLPCVLGMLILAVVIAGTFMKGKSVPAKGAFGAILSGGVALAFLFSFMTGTTAAEDGANAFDIQTAEIRKLIDKGDVDDAEDLLEELVEEYGASDLTTLLSALILAGDSAYDEALAAMGAYSDKGAVEYFSTMETLYLEKGDPTQADPLRALYLEAARRHPMWSYMQKMAGISRLDVGEPAKAEYLLLRATEQDPSDPETLYYLGVVCFNQKRNSDAMNYFQEAMELGASDELEQRIAWYAGELTE